MCDNMDFPILQGSHPQNLTLSLPLPALAWTALTAVRYQGGADPSHVNSTSQAIVCVAPFVAPDTHDDLRRLAQQGYCGNPYFRDESTESQVREGTCSRSHSKQEVELRLNRHLLTPSSELFPLYQGRAGGTCQMGQAGQCLSPALSPQLISTFRC